MEAGYELAGRFTKYKHAFIVAVHTDKAHIHCHIVFNSTTLDCKGKFNNFFGSSFAVRRLSDLICAEHGLSIIENPKPSKGKNYGDWLGDKVPSWKEKLRLKIDEVLPFCSTFEDFLAAMKKDGYEVKENRKYISFCAPEQKRPTRLKSLGENYTEGAISERLENVKIITNNSGSGTQIRVNLLVDIQAKIREGKGAGYEQWARIFNLKQSAKTLLFLKENGIDSYAELCEKSAAASSEFNGRLDRIKASDQRLKEIAELQKHIGTYGKTRKLYEQYKASGWDKDFYEQFRADITLHRTAKKYFDGLKLKKLPTIAALKQEYATLSAEKKKLYAGYQELKENRNSLVTAKSNADRMLNIKNTAKEHDDSRTQKHNNSHER